VKADVDLAAADMVYICVCVGMYEAIQGETRKEGGGDDVVGK